MSSPAYVVDVGCQDVRMQVLMNGYLCYRARDDGRRLAQVKINSFLFEERPNEIVLRLRQTGEKPWCELRLMVGEHGDKDAEPRSLLHFRWHPEEHPIERELEVDVVRHRWTMTHAFGPWEWERATPYANADRPQIEAMLLDIRASLERRDFRRFFELFEVKQQ